MKLLFFQKESNISRNINEFVIRCCYYIIIASNIINFRFI